MKILVTGATGFIGRPVLDLLTRNDHQVLALVRPPHDVAGIENSSVRCLRGDLADLASLKPEIRSFDPEAVIHLAWQGIPDFSPSLCQLNLSQSIALIDLLIKETRCQKIVMSGSCYEYGRSQGPCEESQLTAPASFFTLAKSSLYQYASLRCQEKKISCVWMRPFYVYGPGQRKKSLIPTLIDAFSNQTAPGINNPFNANDFIYVEDVAEGFCRAAGTDVPSGIYNLGSGHATSVIDICELVEQQTSGPTGFTQQIRRASSAQSSVNFWADMRKVQKIFGWTPSVPMDEGIRRSISALERV